MLNGFAFFNTKIFVALSLIFSAFAVQSADTDEILTLSIEELMAIPTDKRPKGRGIFQSDKFPVSQKSVNFGINVPLQKFPYSSAAILAAADLATQAINEQGGINGRPLAIVRADNEHDPEISVNLANQLVSRFNVEAFIGPMTSESAHDVLEQVADQHQVPLMTVRASATDLNQVAKTTSFWRLTANNQRQVELIFSKLKLANRLDRVVFIGSRDLYSEEIYNGLLDLLNDHKRSFLDTLKISTMVDLKVMKLEDRLKTIKKLSPTAIVLVIRPDLSADLLKKLNRTWKQEKPLIVMGDTFNRADASQYELGDIIYCTNYIVSVESEGAYNVNLKLANLSINTSISGYDTAYAFDAVILLSMAKHLSNATELSFKEAMFRLTGEGQQITYRDYHRIESLIKQHRQLSYFGASGFINFNQQGENLKAELAWQTLGDNPGEQPSCLRTLEP